MIAADKFDDTVRRLRQASHEALANAPLLERWFVDRSLGEPCLVGFVSAHPELADGRFVRTSLLLRIAPEAGWAMTRNRFIDWDQPGRVAVDVMTANHQFLKRVRDWGFSQVETHAGELRRCRRSRCVRTGIRGSF